MSPAVSTATEWQDVCLGGVQVYLPLRYTDLRVIGSGSYGQVWGAHDSNTKETVAIKTISCPTHVEGKEALLRWKRLVREIRLLRHFDRHNNLLSLRDVVMPPTVDYTAVHLVTELATTDLQTVMVRCPAHFTDANIFALLYGILDGLCAMHSANVMHRDLKPSNILVRKDGSPVLADYGMSRGESSNPHSDYVVTRWYRAPEIMLGVRYSKKIDVWSLGCIFAEMLAVRCGAQTRDERVLFPSVDASCSHAKNMLCRILRFVGHDPAADLSWITPSKSRAFVAAQSTQPPADLAARFPGVPAVPLDLLRSMLTFDPRARPAATDCFRHPYWREYMWTEGDEDQPWPVFCNEFEEHITSEAAAREVINLEITRFHPAFECMEGVAVSRVVAMETHIPESVSFMSEDTVQSALSKRSFH